MMAKYIVWHPYYGPDEFDHIETAFYDALEKIREMKGKVRNNVTITRVDLPRPVTVAFIRGHKLE